MIRAVIGSVVGAIGVFLIHEGSSAYGDSILMLPGIPLAVIGGLLVLKGGQRYLRGKEALDEGDA